MLGQRGQDDPRLAALQLAQLPRLLRHRVRAEHHAHHGVTAAHHRQLAPALLHPGRARHVEHDVLTAGTPLLAPDHVGGAALVPALVPVLQPLHHQLVGVAPHQRPLLRVLQPGVGGGRVTRGLAAQGLLGPEHLVQVQGGRTEGSVKRPSFKPLEEIYPVLRGKRSNYMLGSWHDWTTVDQEHISVLTSF